MLLEVENALRCKLEQDNHQISKDDFDRVVNNIASELDQYLDSLLDRYEEFM